MPVATSCLTCGAAVFETPSRVARGMGKYCSVPCFRASAGYRKQVRAALPGTIYGIAQRVGVSMDTVRDQLVGLQRIGECHAARLVESDNRGRGLPRMVLLFEAGAGSDPADPIMPRAQLAHYFRKLILDSMPGTQSRLITVTGHSQASMSRIVAELHGAGLCHISGWRRAKAGPVMPVYAAGTGVDKPCRIVPYTSAERSARYMARAERRGTIDAIRARYAAAARTKTMTKTGDPLINALFGRRPAATKEAV